MKQQNFNDSLVLREFAGLLNNKKMVKTAGEHYGVMPDSDIVNKAHPGVAKVEGDVVENIAQQQAEDLKVVNKKAKLVLETLKSIATDLKKRKQVKAYNEVVKTYKEVCADLKNFSTRNKVASSDNTDMNDYKLDGAATEVKRLCGEMSLAVDKGLKGEASLKQSLNVAKRHLNALNDVFYKIENDLFDFKPNSEKDSLSRFQDLLSGLGKINENF